MNLNIKENIFLKGVAGTFSSIGIIFGFLWLFAEPPINNKIDERISFFLDSPAMSVYIDNVIKEYKAEQEKKDSGKIKLRKLLSNKMKCDEDEVHIRLGILYLEEKKHLEDAELELKEVKNRIKILENKNS